MKGIYVTKLLKLTPIQLFVQFEDGGYDIQDFRKVNPLFGTNEDLSDLFKEAKRLGLRIILDLVRNKM